MKVKYQNYIIPDWAYFSNEDSHKAKGLGSIVANLNSGVDVANDIFSGRSLYLDNDALDLVGMEDTFKYFSDKYKYRQKYIIKSYKDEPVPLYHIQFPDAYAKGNLKDSQNALPLPFLRMFKNVYRVTEPAPVKFEENGEAGNYARFSKGLTKLPPEFCKGVYLEGLGYIPNGMWSPIFNPVGYTYSGTQQKIMQRIDELDMYAEHDKLATFENIVRAHQNGQLGLFKHHDESKALDYYKEKYKTITPATQYRVNENELLNTFTKNYDPTKGLALLDERLK